MKHIFIRMGLKYMAICMLLICFSGHSSEVFGQCDPIILDRADQNPELAYRKFNNRCEGFYRAEVSGSAITVMGFTVGGFRFNRDKTEVVKISLPYHSDRNVHIQAKAIPVKTFYRMDADLDAGRTLFWPIQDIIYKCTNDLTSDQIGLCAWITTNYREMNDDKIFVPVRAESSELGPPEDDEILLTVRVSQDIVKLLWRMNLTSIDGQKTKTKWEEPKKGTGQIRMGEPITIVLPKGMPEGTVMPVELELAARIKDSDEWIKDFVLLDLGDGQKHDQEKQISKQ